ncbi:MAG: hypothetical protein DRP71_14995 [Verrucomicrobia bacterium]|nr:MAG: hypothetical protein DRP71_14995 [Verrucomicrobiota bacterium]
MGDGGIIVTYCRSDEHMGPSGTVLAVRSYDEGLTWSSPIVVRDSVLDDRENGLTALADGRLLVHVWSTHHTCESYDRMADFSYEPAVVEKWMLEVQAKEYLAAAGQKGGWILMSADHGLTWELQGPGPDSIHGGIQLASGDVLVASYRGENGNIGLFRASPDDLVWERLSVFTPPELPDRRFGEPHIVQLPSGRVVLMLRSTAIPYDDQSSGNHLWVAWSDDEGRTWSEGCSTGLWGYPPHLLPLSDGRILSTYGCRRKPYGERACISSDGINWDPAHEVVLRDDADSLDLGYPASIELESGRILTVYYQSPHCSPPAEMHPPDPLRHKPDIVGTIWEIS